MARTEAVAVAGFYATPQSQIAPIAAMLSLPVVEIDESEETWQRSQKERTLAVCDPCAGEGEAVHEIARLLFGDGAGYTGVNFFACEMESGRHQALEKRVQTRPGNWKDKGCALAGDAFQVVFDVEGQYREPAGVGLLYLNPPYDVDRDFGRLEERFLRRFTSVLADDGVLAFVVPHASLAASAKTLATSYGDLTCWRFQGAEFDAYKQVVLFARKLPEDLFEPDVEVAARVEEWAADASSIPELPVPGETSLRYALPTLKAHVDALPTWKMSYVDVTALAEKFRPWHETTRARGFAPVSRILPDLPIAELMHRTYEVATPPRPAHIAAGIAAGIFNGQKIEADDVGLKLPPLLIKGVFDREWRTVEEKHNKEGEKTGEVQVQQPKLVVTVLDLDAHCYHTVGSAETGALEVSGMGVPDLLKRYGQSLMGVMERQCRILYDPREDAGTVELAPLKRKLYDAQAHAARACVALLREREQRGEPLLLGEIGCLRADTRIFDPTTGEEMTVGERYRRREPFHVWARGAHGEPVIAAAMPPVKYPTAQMVKVTMSDGNSVVVTPAHRFWDGTAWVKASTISERIFEKRWQLESAPVLLESISDTDLSIRAAGGSRWSQTTPGFQDDYRRERCSYDEQLLLDRDIVPEPVPSRDGVHGHNRHCLHEDDQEHAVEHNRVCQGSYHPSTKGFVNRAEDRHLSQHHRQRGLRSRLDSDLSRVRSKSPAGSCPVHTSNELELYVLSSTPVSCESFRQQNELLESKSEDRLCGKALLQSPEGVFHSRIASEPTEHLPVSISSRLDYNLTKKMSTVVSVESVESEPYYDFHVPVFNNYWAVGLWHHNSGKSSVAYATAKTVGAKTILVLCPPHLLDSWRNEVEALDPQAEFVVLQTVSDVDALDELPEDQVVVAALSRETAKLGHAWEPVGAQCSSCGASTPRKVDFAKTRARCEARSLVAEDDYAKFARQLAIYLRPHALGDIHVRNVLRGHLDDKYPVPKSPSTYAGLPEDFALRLRSRLAHDYRFGNRREEECKKAIALCFAASPNLDHLLKFIAAAHSDGYDYERFHESLAALIHPESGDMVRVREAFKALSRGRYDSVYNGYGPANRLEERAAAQVEKKYKVSIAGIEISLRESEVLFGGEPLGGVEVACQLLRYLTAIGQWRRSEVCGEFLYQAVPEPRRYPLAQYIVNRHKKTFDFLILDEFHEYQNADTAQGLAANRLTTLRLPTVAMTGSVMNGYATSLFANMHSLSPDFREEFDRGDIVAFNDRYGYRKQLVQDRKEGEVIAFGSQTDRVERSQRDIGTAPGVLPLFLFRHLLPQAVTIHKADLRIDLPPFEQNSAPVQPDGALLANYKQLLAALGKQIKADRFQEGLAGKLFGALSELPSYLDRATEDVGCGDEGASAYEIRYPESCGGDLVASVDLLPANTVLPKERWLLDKLEVELAEGRNAMVFGWHVELLPRLQRLIEKHVGVKAPVLYANKVPTAKRQAWIDKEIVNKKARVMIANPVCIQTGLNNLVHFHTEIWHENPACNPIVYRQAIGRIDRIGQRKSTRVRFAYYDGTLQKNMFDLLIAKVAISTATDGLDPESALIASGVTESDYLTGLSIGKQLWAMMVGDLPVKKERKA